MLKRLLSDTAVYGGADFASKLVALLSFPIIAGTLGTSLYGTLELTLSFTLIMGLIANCGLNNALQRFYWDRDTPLARRPVLVSSGLVILTAFLTLSAAFGAFIAAIMQALELWDLSFTGISLIGIIAAFALMVFTQISQFILDVLRLHFAPWRFFAVSFLSRVGTAGLGVVGVLWFGFRLDGLLLLQAFAIAVSVPLGLWMIRKDLTRAISSDSTRQLVAFGYPFIFAGLAFWVFSSMDRWMLASIRSIEEVGVYSVANRFSMVVMFFSTAFGLAWSPISIKLRTDQPEKYRQTYAAVLVVLTGAMLIVATTLAVFSDTLLTQTMSGVFANAAPALAILSLGIVFQATQQITGAGISLERKTQLFAYFSWVAAGVNFTANLILIPPFGVLGAAWATTMSYFVLTAGYLWASQRLHPLPLDWARLSGLLAVWLLVAVCSPSLRSDLVSGANLLLKLGTLLGVIAVICALIWKPSVHVTNT